MQSATAPNRLLHHMNFDDINVFDEGQESTPAVNEEGTEEKSSDIPDSQVDSAAETKEEATNEKTQDASPEGEKVSEKAGEKKEDELSDDDIARLESEAEAKIAEGKAPKWFKNVVENVYKKNVQKAQDSLAVYEPLKDYGDVTAIQEELEIIKGLDSFTTDPQTNLPVSSVKPFVEKFVEKKGIEKVFAVMQEFGNLSSPYNKGYSVFDEIVSAYGLDPTRIEDFKKFASNGYRTANDGIVPPDEAELELIPEGLREAFASLTPDQRDELLILDDSLRDLALSGIQNKLDSERKKKESELSEAQKKVEQEQKEKQEFFQKVGEKETSYINASGEKLFDSFAESLVNAGLDEIETLGIANLMSMTLNSNGVEAKRNIEALSKIGVKLDESLMTTFSDWMKAGRNTAFFEIRGDEANYKAAKAQFEDLEEKLIRKSNPIVAAIAKHRAATARNVSESRSSVLQDLNKNNGINANEGEVNRIGSNSRSSASWEDIPVFANN